MFSNFADLSMGCQTCRRSIQIPSRRKRSTANRPRASRYSPLVRLRSVRFWLEQFSSRAIVFKLIGTWQNYLKQESSIKYLSDSFSLNFKPSYLFNQNEAEIVLRVFGSSNNVDGEAVLTNSGENIDSAGLHGRPSFVRMPTSLFEGARATESARSSPQAKSLVVPAKEGLPLHFGSYFLCIKQPCLEQDGPFI